VRNTFVGHVFIALDDFDRVIRCVTVEREAHVGLSAE